MLPRPGERCQLRLKCEDAGSHRVVGPREGSVLTSSVLVMSYTTVHSKKRLSAGSGELPCLAILWYTVQCRAIRNLQKGPKRHLNWGSNRKCTVIYIILLCKWSERPGFSWFLPNSVLWGQNLAEILFLLWLAFWRNRLQKHKSIPWGIAKKKETKTQNLTRLWPKARISTFSEWTVDGR